MVSTYPSEKWRSSSLGMMTFRIMEKSSIHVPNHQPKRNWQEYRKNKGNLQICFSIINQLHGAGIFTYMTGWFCVNVGVHIPAPWSSWVRYCEPIFWRELMVAMLDFEGIPCMLWNNYSAGCEGQFSHQTWPIGSMYGIYGNIYRQYTPNVTIYTIHGSYGWYQTHSNTVFKHSHHMAMGQNSRHGGPQI